LLAGARAATAAVIVPDADGRSVTVRDTSRIVAVGGSVTEIVYALGLGERLVGCDTSGTYPAAAAKLPKVGYQRALSAEGVLSLQPTLVLATTDAGPPAALAQIRSAGVTTLVLPAAPTVAGAKEKIRRFARALGRAGRGEALVRALEADLAAARRVANGSRRRPRVLFLYARGAGTLLVAGRDSSADTMIRRAGGENAVSGYAGYKPLTAEAAVAAAPEVILVLDRGLESVGGAAGLLKLPGLALTPAGRSRQIVAMDDLYLIGFGPRMGRAARDLAVRLHASPVGRRP
jgi:iron complex transport system substrate-binding protein